MGVIAEKGGTRFMGAVELARGWSPGMSVMSQTETLLLQKQSCLTLTNNYFVNKTSLGINIFELQVRW